MRGGDDYCFKPYKGVSSNLFFFLKQSSKNRVSNPIREYLQMIFFVYVPPALTGFKPYKGVSSNLTFYHLNEDLYLCFKPYKGVSSNS